MLGFGLSAKLNPSLFARSAEGRMPSFAVSFKIDLSPLEAALAKKVEGGGPMEASRADASPVPKKERASELDSIHRRGRGSVESYELGHEPRIVHAGV